MAKLLLGSRKQDCPSKSRKVDTKPRRHKGKQSRKQRDYGKKCRICRRAKLAYCPSINQCKPNKVGACCKPDKVGACPGGPKDHIGAVTGNRCDGSRGKPRKVKVNSARAAAAAAVRRWIAKKKRNSSPEKELRARITMWRKNLKNEKRKKYRYKIKNSITAAFKQITVWKVRAAMARVALKKLKWRRTTKKRVRFAPRRRRKRSWFGSLVKSISKSAKRAVDKLKRQVPWFERIFDFVGNVFRGYARARRQRRGTNWMRIIRNTKLGKAYNKVFRGINRFVNKPNDARRRRRWNRRRRWTPKRRWGGKSKKRRSKWGKA